MDFHDQIIKALHAELDSNHFDCHIASLTSWHSNRTIVINSGGLSTYFIQIHKDNLEIHERRAGGYAEEQVFTAALAHPRAIGAIMSYLHRNCDFGQSVRNMLGYNPHRTIEDTSPKPKKEKGLETTTPAES